MIGFEKNIISSGGTGTSSGIYAGNSPTTISVGGLNAGENILGDTYDDIFEQMLTPYVSPSFSSFSIVGQSNVVESGNTIFGNKSFAFGFSQIGNILANSLDLFSGATQIANNVALVSPATANVPLVNLVGNNVNYSFQGRATNSNNQIFNSPLFTVTSLYRQFFGNTANFPTTSAQVRALANSNFTNSNSFSTPVVNTTKFSIAIPASKNLASVITANFENITTAFTLSTFNVNDFAGNPIAYKIYNYESAIPLNLILNITLS